MIESIVIMRIAVEVKIQNVSAKRKAVVEPLPNELLLQLVILRGS